jgi:hypothetical protein
MGRHGLVAGVRQGGPRGEMSGEGHVGWHERGPGEGAAHEQPGRQAWEGTGASTCLTFMPSITAQSVANQGSGLKGTRVCSDQCHPCGDSRTSKQLYRRANTIPGRPPIHFVALKN